MNDRLQKAVDQACHCGAPIVRVASRSSLFTEEQLTESMLLAGSDTIDGFIRSKRTDVLVLRLSRGFLSQRLQALAAAAVVANHYHRVLIAIWESHENCAALEYIFTNVALATPNHAVLVSDNAAYHTFAEASLARQHYHTNETVEAKVLADLSTAVMVDTTVRYPEQSLSDVAHVDMRLQRFVRADAPNMCRAHAMMINRSIPRSQKKITTTGPRG